MVVEKVKHKREKGKKNLLDWVIGLIAITLVIVMLVQVVYSYYDVQIRLIHALNHAIGDEDMSWVLSQNVTSSRNVVFWLMIGATLILPLAKVKAFDKGYEGIRKLPIEFVAVGAWIAWIFVHSNIWTVAINLTNSSSGVMSGALLSAQFIHFVYFFGLLFIALCLTGYVVCYVKDIYTSKDKTLKDDSLIYKLCTQIWVVDLKKSQSLRIFVLVFGQVLVGLGLALFSVLAIPNNPFPFLVFVLVPSYLTGVFLYARYKVAKVRQDYLHLFEITKELANGNLKINTPDDLGYFESLKNELITIQDGLGYAVEQRVVSERMKGELITNVSHDLKTPLTSIITYVDLLNVDDLDEEKKKQYLNTLVVKTDRLKTLVEDLFEVSKATTGNMTMDLMEVDVVTLMKQTLLGLEDLVMESGLIFKEGYPEKPVKLMLDGGRIHRVFENLIINMLKYAMIGTRAYIDIIDGKSEVDIILRNISKHEIKHDLNNLAERFVRGDEARNTEGSGLGLAIAKSFVELQGGTFEIVVDGDLFKVFMTFRKSSY